MLSQKVSKQWVACGFAIQRGSDKFIEMCRITLKEFDKEWVKGDIPALFRRLAREVRILLCDCTDGPKLAMSTLNRYMNAARKSILFGIPFKMTQYVPIEKLGTIREIVENDIRDIPNDEKVKSAIKSLQRDRRQPIERKVQVDWEQLEALISQYGKELKRAKAKKNRQPLSAELAAELVGCLTW